MKARVLGLGVNEDGCGGYLDLEIPSIPPVNMRCNLPPGAVETYGQGRWLNKTVELTLTIQHPETGDKGVMS